MGTTRSTAKSRATTKPEAEKPKETTPPAGDQDPAGGAPTPTGVHMYEVFVDGREDSVFVDVAPDTAEDDLDTVVRLAAGEKDGVDPDQVTGYQLIPVPEDPAEGDAVTSPPANGEEPGEHTDVRPELADGIVEPLTAEDIDEALDELTPEQRTALLQRLLAGQDPASVAAPAEPTGPVLPDLTGIEHDLTGKARGGSDYVVLKSLFAVTVDGVYRAARKGDVVKLTREQAERGLEKGSLAKS